jgi:signal transduction histidine kinase
VRRRLLSSYLSLTLFVLIALGVPLGLSFANTEHRRLENEVEHDAFALSQRAGAFADGSADAGTLARVVTRYETDTGARVVVVDRTGAMLLSAPGARRDAVLGPDVDAALRGRNATASRTDARFGDVLSVAVPILVRGQVEGAVGIEYPGDVVDGRIERNWLLLGGLAGVIALVVLLVSSLLARSFTRPLAELDRGASRLGEGDLAVRVSVPTDPPELRGLARSFNATAAQLETLVRSQQAFVADASHQLRTPLAALRLRLENLEAEGPELRAGDVEHALAEVGRLSQLVDSLLVLARAGEVGAAPEPVDLTRVIAGRQEAWTALAHERRVRIETDVEATIVRSQPGRLEQVLDNLLDNALDAAPPGTAVRIVARRLGDRAVVQVCDAGAGMTDEQRARAFDRFWRANPSRRHGRGFGLGLAIVRQLVTADGGRVNLATGPEGGLVVVMDFPLVPTVGPVPQPVALASSA